MTKKAGRHKSSDASIEEMRRTGLIDENRLFSDALMNQIENVQALMPEAERRAEIGRQRMQAAIDKGAPMASCKAASG
jgi:hypothetical protein